MNEAARNPHGEFIYLTWRRANPPMTYEVLAAQFQTTRNTVAGIIHRKRKTADGVVITRGIKSVWANRTRPLGE